MPTPRKLESGSWQWAILLVPLVWMLVLFLPAPEQVDTIPYSQFEQMLAQGKVQDLSVGADRITGARVEPAPGEQKRFQTYRVDPSLAQMLSSARITYSGSPPSSSWLSTAVAMIWPVVGLVLLWNVFRGGAAGGLMAVGKSRAKIYAEDDVKVRFDDVAGVDEAKEELRELVAFLKDPEEYGRLGAHVPKGVLLVGAPGTGKTLLARAVAGEAGVPFLSIAGSEFIEMFVGVGAARVRDLFEQARQRAPAIIFIDELDSLGRARSAGIPGGGHEEKDQTLNQLLAELDGFDPRSGVVLLAATNRPEILDPALLRAGRFDRQILVDRPDRKGRLAILKVHVRGVTIAEDVELEDVAAMTAGYTGADLANLINEAALLATRRHAQAVTFDDFTTALERIVAGLEKRNRVITPHEREVVAHHEIGHALVAMALPGADKVQKVTIIPHGVAALGFTTQKPTEERWLMGQAELENRLAVLLGGRMAEQLAFGEISTGAADDLEKATAIARSMVARFGMDQQLGAVSYEPQRNLFLQAPGGVDWQPRQYSEATASGIDAAVRHLLAAASDHARAILEANEALLRRSAATLLARETLSGVELGTIASAVRGPEGKPEPGTAGIVRLDPRPSAGRSAETTHS